MVQACEPSAEKELQGQRILHNAILSPKPKPTKQHSEREHASLQGDRPQFHLQGHKKKYRQIYSESIKHMVIQADIYEVRTFTNELLLKDTNIMK